MVISHPCRARYSIGRSLTQGRPALRKYSPAMPVIAFFAPNSAYAGEARKKPRLYFGCYYR